MELWNTRKLNAPPTYTYQAKSGEVDIDHLGTILQDGLKFYREQYLLNFETALLARIIYRMKRKFRNSKDFQTLEKVKKDLMIFLQIDICKKLELLLSILPNNFHQSKIFLPTKNMMDFILVRLQGVGKILCRIVEMSKLTMEYYECRLHLGHFWRLALVAIGLVSRIYVVSLNIIKFTCLLYLRLLPFTHKLKNSGAEWLPADYIFPKDLKEWLNVEWSKLDEVIEIPDKDFEISLIDLVDDSDDDVEFCNEYIELDEDDVEIIEEFKRINKRIKPIDYEHNITILRGFSSNDIDTGVVVSSAEDIEIEENEQGDIQLNSNDEEPSPVSSTMPVLEQNAKQTENISVEEIDLGEVTSSSEDVNEILNILDNNETTSKTAIDHHKNLYANVSEKNLLKYHQKQIQFEADVLISTSNEEFELSSDDSIQFVEEVVAPYKRPSMVTSDFISLNTVKNRFPIQGNRVFPRGISRNLSRKRKERSVDKNIEDPPYSLVKRECVKLPHTSIKTEKAFRNPLLETSRINTTLRKRERGKEMKNKHLGIGKLMNNPEKKKDTNGNNSEENRNEVIELSGSFSSESIKVTPVSVGRKRKWKNGSRSNKRSRYSKDTTVDIVDVSTEVRNINNFHEDTPKSSAQSVLELSDTSERNMTGKENHQEKTSWNESFQEGEHTFSESIENTSTPAKKRRRLKKKKKGKNSICLKDSTIEMDNKSKKQKSIIISDMKQFSKKQYKKMNKGNKRSTVCVESKYNVTKMKKDIKNNNSSILCPQSFQDNTNHFVSSSSNYSDNISFDANRVTSPGKSIMNNSKRKNKSKMKTLKRRKKGGEIKSSPKNEFSKSKVKRKKSNINST